MSGHSIKKRRAPKKKEGCSKTNQTKRGLSVKDVQNQEAVRGSSQKSEVASGKGVALRLTRVDIMEGVIGLGVSYKLERL